MWCKYAHADTATVTKTSDSTLSARAFSHARHTEIPQQATVKRSCQLEVEIIPVKSVAE